MRNEVSEKLQKCLCSVREKTDFVPQVAIVLGSGLGDYADGIQVEAEIDYKEIEVFPTSHFSVSKTNIFPLLLLTIENIGSFGIEFIATAPIFVP